MVDKSFYSAAAQEVAGGFVDDALWVKVTADMPTAERSVRQAKYIQLRAQELAVERAKATAWSAWARVPRWVKAVILIAACVVAGYAVLIIAATVLAAVFS